jgi:hypothetical protein
MNGLFHFIVLVSGFPLSFKIVLFCNYFWVEKVSGNVQYHIIYLSRNYFYILHATDTLLLFIYHLLALIGIS